MSRRRRTVDLPLGELSRSTVEDEKEQAHHPLRRDISFIPTSHASLTHKDDHNHVPSTASLLGLGLGVYGDSDEEKSESEDGRLAPDEKNATRGEDEKEEAKEQAISDLPLPSMPADASSNGNKTSSASSPSRSDGLPPNWTTCLDGSSGDVYYWNKVTDETRWEKPTVTNLSSTIKSATAPSVSSPNPFPASAASSAPASALESSHPSVSTSSSTTTKTTPPLPAGWQEVTDPSTHDVYYWNETTDETTWDRPTADTATATTTTSKIDDQIENCTTATTASKVEATTAPSALSSSSSSSSSSATIIASPSDAISTPSPQPAAPSPTPGPTAPLSTSANFLFISALLAGLHARIRDPLELSVMSLATNTTVEQAISPIQRLAVQLEWIERQWTKAQTHSTSGGIGSLTLEQIAPMILDQLQLLTIEVDDVLAREKVWRQVKASTAAAHTSVPVESTSSFLSSSSHPPPPAFSNSTSSILNSAPTVTAPLPTSGFVHPSRLAMGVHAAAAAPPGLKKRTIDHASSASDSTEMKSKKPRMSKEMGSLLSKWQSVSKSVMEEDDF